MVSVSIRPSLIFRVACRVCQLCPLFLFVPGPAFADEIEYPGNDVSVTVSQQYIISPDVVASGDIVASQFDGLVRPDQLPSPYGDTLSSYMDYSWSYFQDWSKSKISERAPSFVDDQFAIMQALSSNNVHNTYGITATNLGVASSNVVPSQNIISNVIPIFRDNPYSTNNYFRIHRFGEFDPSEKFTLDLTDNSIPQFLRRRFELSGGNFQWFCMLVNNFFVFFARILGFFLIVRMCRDVVDIFVGS